MRVGRRVARSIDLEELPHALRRVGVALLQRGQQLLDELAQAVLSLGAATRTFLRSTEEQPGPEGTAGEGGKHEGGWESGLKGKELDRERRAQEQSELVPRCSE